MVVKLNHSVLTVCKIAIKTFSINEKIYKIRHRFGRKSLRTIRDLQKKIIVIITMQM